MAAPVVALALLGAACSSHGSSGSAPVSPPSGANAEVTTKEVANVSLPRPYIDKLTAALKANDLSAATAALEGYDAAWGGVDAYVDVRSLSLYQKLQTDLETHIADGLSKPAPDYVDLAATSQTLGQRYNDAISLSKNGPTLSPLFDDLATVRLVRSDLRIATAALNNNNLAKATAAFNRFHSGFQPAYELIKARSSGAATDTQNALDETAAKFAGKASIDDLKTSLATLTNKYNVGVNLLNAAARYADTTKTSVTDRDLLRLGSLADVEVQLGKSLVAWQSGDYTRAGTLASAIGTTIYPRLQPALSDKGSDGGLKKALDDFSAVAGPAGDAAKVSSTNDAALAAVALARQVLVGQFWTDPRVQGYVANLPKADVLT